MNSQFGRKNHVSNENMVDLLLKLFEWINDQQVSQSYIQDSFALCGLNKYVEYQSIFKAHLDSLPVNISYDSLLCTKKSMKLKDTLNCFQDDTPEEDATKYYDDPVNKP